MSIKNRLSEETILSHLNCDINVFCFNTIDSTNNEAKRRTDLLSCSPALFVANHQSAGRGRLGRTFFSPDNTGLYMSLLLQTDSDFSNIVTMTTATAVCVAKALEELCEIKPQIKWVNDIYLNDKKICGILCEAITNENTFTIDGIVIGIGVNISTTDFPDELKDIASSVGQDIDKAKLCAKITDNILDVFKNIKNKSFIDEYKNRCMVLGREITYTENGEKKSATAIDIDQNGGLVIKTHDGTKTLSTGEITVRIKND